MLSQFDCRSYPRNDSAAVGLRPASRASRFDDSIRWDLANLVTGRGRHSEFAARSLHLASTFAAAENARDLCVKLRASAPTWENRGWVSAWLQPFGHNAESSFDILAHVAMRSSLPLRPISSRFKTLQSTLCAIFSLKASTHI